MASIGNDGGLRRILFYDVGGERKTIRLGRCSKANAEKIKHRVEQLLTAKILGGTLERDDAFWLAGEGLHLRPKLEAVGLVAPLEPKLDKPRQLLSEFLAGYMQRHGASKKPGTRAVWRQVFDNLNEYMPDGIYLDEVTAGHAKAFHEQIKPPRMAASTCDKRVRFARQFFADAVDWELIPSNPFARIKTTSGSTKSNVSVPAELIQQILPHCDLTWKTIVALSRFGGLRCPSEVLSLRWADIDWEQGRMAVIEPKVEHHEGRGVRACPIFAELRPFLEEAWDAARDGAEFVIDNQTYRQLADSADGWKSANLRTQFDRIVRRAGVVPWKRLFHSMRASRQTELERQFPLHVVCAWLGNSVRIAQKSYLLVTDDDYTKAIDGAARNAARLEPEAARNPAPHTARTPMHTSTTDQENAGESAFSQGKLGFNQRRGQDSNLRTSFTQSHH